jgi:DNA replication protein DnaC
MANLYPNIIINHKSNAEVKIFNIFKTFSNDFHIIHSLPWLSILTANEQNRFTPEGEIDFVILHKNYGILCIEIKGGRISYRKNAYFTNGNNRIKNPFDQVRDSNHYLRKVVDNILIGYCVGFPDSEKPKFIDNHPSITFDIHDLENLENKIISIFQYWKQCIKKKIPTESDILSILKRLLPESKDELNQKIIYDNKQWLTPSKEQSKIIENALKMDKFFIKGRAGTGKTILSIIMARELLNLDSQILFLTFNKIINKYIQKQFESINIDVYTFHKFLSENNVLRKNIIDDTDFILNYMIEHITNKYDVLIIDEAQSFRQTWLDSLSKYFKNKKVYIFADSLQSFSNEGKITDKVMNAIFHFDDEKTLIQNFRSPRKVYERLLEMFSSSIQQVSPRNVDELDLVE